MSNFDLKKYLAEGKLYEAVDPTEAEAEAQKLMDVLGVMVVPDPQNSSDTIRLTRHTQASTLEKFYIGEDQEYNAEIANKVDSEFFDFAKLAAV